MKKKLPVILSFGLRLLVLALLPLLFTTCAPKPEVPTREEAQKAVMDKIEAACKAWASGNTMVFYENAAEDIVWIDDVGPSKRLIGRDALKTYLEELNGNIPPHKHELFDFKLQFYGDVVIASYYYQGTMEGEKAPPWKAVTVFKYTDGDWFAVLEHWTENIEVAVQA